MPKKKNKLSRDRNKSITDDKDILGLLVNGKTGVTNNPTPVNVDDIYPLPTKGARSSLPFDGLGFSGFVMDTIQISNEFRDELYDAMKKLAIWNGDVSYAVENIVTLANTEFKVYFGDDTDKELNVQMNAHLAAVQKKWYNYSDGTNALVNDLLSQLFINGALSAENIPNNSLTGIRKVDLVAPKNVVFVYDDKKDEYLPYQKGGNIMSSQAKLGTIGMIPLNTATYVYKALRRFDSRPYGIPPILAALEGLSIERDMMCNFKSIIKRLGMFGFLQVLLQAPTKLPSESATAYQKRAATYLDTVAPELEKGFSNGIVVGFNGVHNFQVTGNNLNMSGTKDIYQLNDTIKMAGLKQDPMMLGRNFSTTETVGRVILAKLSKQVTNYQAVVAGFLEDLFMLELRLAGYNPSSIKVEFDKPIVSDQSKDEAAFAQRINNANMLYEGGVISQEQKAQMLGWDKPDQSKPREIATGANSTDNGITAAVKDNKGGGVNNDDATGEKSTGYSMMVNDFEYDYGLEDECGEGHTHLSLSLDSEASNEYYNSLSKQYDDVVYNLSVGLTSKLKSVDKTSGYRQVYDAILAYTILFFNREFNGKSGSIIKNSVRKIYENAKDGDQPINSNELSLMDYFEKSDAFYVGRFIADESTANKIAEFVKEHYDGGTIPLGSDNAEFIVTEFRRKFAEMLQTESWKILRIVNTTSARLEYAATINYLNQLGIKMFKIVSKNDKARCKYCEYLDGKTMSVATAAKNLEDLSKTPYDSVSLSYPFLTSEFKGKAGLERLSKLSGETLQQLGFDLLPAHSNCRCKVVAA